jgi:Na+:H+ antiporter, NhaA family
MTPNSLGRVRDAVAAFIQTEAASGVLLLAAAAVALAVSNSPALPLYADLLDLKVGGHVGPLTLEKTLLHWINDGLMAVFFLVVGLEIKRELVEGELSTPAQAALPGIAALGGMAVPALIYVGLNLGDGEALKGWAIAAATDIAFALGVLALLGPRVPASLKVFLVALAIIDDLGAILIIALFYSSDLSWWSLSCAGLAVAALLLLNRLGVVRIWPYLLLGAVLWLFVLKSGVHATMAGVATALAVPAAGRGEGISPLARLESALHPWVAYLVMPAFAFANAGVPLSGIAPATLFSGIPLGIALGLFLGKQIGAFGASWLAIRAGWARPPEGAGFAALYGTCLLAGIGFTMSLFIGTLAFPGAEQAAPLRLGVLAGSILSGISGFIVLSLTTARRAAGREHA